MTTAKYACILKTINVFGYSGSQWRCGRQSHPGRHGGSAGWRYRLLEHRDRGRGGQSNQSDQSDHLRQQQCRYALRYTQVSTGTVISMRVICTGDWYWGWASPSELSWGSPRGKHCVVIVILLHKRSLLIWS